MSNKHRSMRRQGKLGMLVLKVEAGQALRIGDVTVRVMRAGPGQVRLGIIAPPDTAVTRAIDNDKRMGVGVDH